MSFDQLAFWILTVLALVGVYRVYWLTKRCSGSVLKRLVGINHLLFFLLPIMVVIHFGEEYGRWVEFAARAERVLFPVYLWALLSHVVVNWGYFNTEDLD